MSALLAVAGPVVPELELLAAVLEDDPEGVCIVAGDGRLVYANPIATAWASEPLPPEIVAVLDQGGPTTLGEVTIKHLPHASGLRLVRLRASAPPSALDLLRRLQALTSERRMTLEQRLDALFRLGVDHFGMERAIQARVEGRYHVVERVVDPTELVSVGDEHPLNRTWCHHTLRANAPFAVHDAQSSAQQEHRCRELFPYQAYLGAPVFVDAVRAGTLAFTQDTPRAPFTEADRALAGLMAQWVGHELARDRDRALYQKAQEDLDRLARTDVLTKLPNRRAVLEALHWQVAYARRARLPLTVVICDLDHFKSINDRYGHDGGDLALQAFSDLCRTVKRETDLAGRWGGEEFLLVLPDTGIEGARVFCQRLLVALREVAVTMPSGDTVGLRASLGVARVWATETDDAAISRADAALYRAKSQGRDQAVFDDGGTPVALPRQDEPTR